MKSILVIVLLLKVVVFGASAQSPWVVPPSSPGFKTGSETGSVIYMHTPQPNVLWGLAASVSQPGPRTRTYSQTVFSTVDNGQSWQTVRTGERSAAIIQDLSALDDKTAWMSYNWELWHTTSGPAGFTMLPTTLPNIFQSIHFFTATTGINVCLGASASEPLRFYRTVDGGSTWTQLSNAPAILREETSNLYEGASFFQNKCSIGRHLWLTTYTGTLLHTADNGLTWTATPGLGSVAFEQDALHGIAYWNTASGPQLSRTEDGGTTWLRIPYSGQRYIVNMTTIPGSPGTYISSNATYSPSIVAETTISRDKGNSWQVLSTSTERKMLFNRLAANTTQVWAGAASDVFRYAGIALTTKNSSNGPLRLTAYPNPTTRMTQLQGPLAGDAQVQVYNVAGQLCHKQTISDKQRTIDLSSQVPGVYHIIVTEASGTGVTSHLRLIKYNE